MSDLKVQVKKISSQGVEVTGSVQENFRLWIAQDVRVFTSVGAYKDFTDSVFRIVPYLALENSTVIVDPFRYKITKKNSRPVFGNWCYPITLIEYFGRSKLSMTLEYQFGQRLSTEEFMEHPYVVLRREISRAVTNERLETGEKVNPDWFGAVGKTTLKSKILPSPQAALLARVLVYKYGDEEFCIKKNGMLLSHPVGWPDREDGNYAILALQGTAKDAFIAAMEKRKDTAPEVYDEDDISLINDIYYYGDIIAPDTGKFIYFFKSTTDPREREKYLASLQNSEDELEAIMNLTVNSDQRGVPYNCFLSPYYPWYKDVPPAEAERKDRVISAVLSSKSLVKLAQTQREWKDLLRFKTLSEQIEIINSSFPPDMLMYAYRNYPQYLTSTTRNLSKAVTYSFPKQISEVPAPNAVTEAHPRTPPFAAPAQHGRSSSSPGRASPSIITDYESDSDIGDSSQPKEQPSGFVTELLKEVQSRKTDLDDNEELI